MHMLKLKGEGYPLKLFKWLVRILFVVFVSVKVPYRAEYKFWFKNLRYKELQCMHIGMLLPTAYTTLIT